MCNRKIMMINSLTRCYKSWKRLRVRGWLKRGGKKLREGERESKDRGKHLGTKGVRSEERRVGKECLE